MENKYKVIEGIKLKVKFNDKYINLGDSFILSLNSTISDYFWNYWEEYNFDIPTDDLQYNFILANNEIYSINNNNYNWKSLIIEDDWKGYLSVNEDNNLNVVYSDMYIMIRELSSFKTMKQNKLILIKLIQLMESKKEKTNPFFEDDIFKDYKEIYSKLKERYDELLYKSKKFIEDITDKSMKEVKNILKKTMYSSTYYKLIVVHKLNKKTIETHLQKHENLYDLLK